MKREKLKLLFKEALISTLSTVKSLLEEKQYVTVWPLEEPEFLPNGSIKGIHIVSKPLIFSVTDIQQKVSRLPQVSKLCDFVAGNDLSKQIVSKQMATPASEQLFHRLFWPFLGYYLSEVEGLEFDQNVFQDTYEEIIAYFGLPTIRLVFTAPLLGFDTESSEKIIDLSPNVSINQISSELKRQLWRDASISSSWSNEDVVSLKYQSTFTEDVPKTALFSYSAYPEDIESLQSLLRLIKREPISIMCVLFSSSPWYLGSYTGIMPRYLLWSTAKPLIGRWLSAASFQGQIMASSFSSREIETLKLLWASLLSMKNITRLSLALRRFSFSYDRPTQEDKLLDIWVGLELLFPDVIGVTRGASQRRLREITNFLSLNRTDRRHTNKDLQNSYDLRSEIVHGYLPYRHNLGILTPKTEDIFTKSLLQSLAQHSLPQP
ncbi:hypothetical protein ES702_04280 [subsurface metagenome]